MRICRRLTYCVMGTGIIGCAMSQPYENPYYDKSLPYGRHVLIEALNGDQKVHKANYWNPYNRGNWGTTLTAIGSASATSEDQLTKGQWSSLLVVPGSYVAQVKCTGKGFYVWRGVPLSNLVLGQEYALECYGFSAHAVRVQVHSRTANSSSIEDEPTAAPIKPDDAQQSAPADGR